MQEERAGLCPAVAANRHQQVFLACCWVTVASRLSSLATDTCVFACIAQTTKIPVVTFEYPGVVDSKLVQTLSFYLRNGNQYFKTQESRFGVPVPRSSPGFTREFTRVECLPTGGLWFPHQVITAALDWAWTTERGRHCSKHFHILSHHIHDSPMSLPLLLAPFYPWGTCGG